MNLLTTAQAAERLGVSVRRVQALIAADRLRSIRYGKVYLLLESDVKRFKPQPPGWKKGRKRGTA